MKTMRIVQTILLLTATLALNSAWAKTRIAFLENYDSHGNLIQYEPGGRFAHTAIQYDEIGNQWLNSYPGEGVAIISEERLKEHGTITAIVEIPEHVPQELVQKYLGKPFDFRYSWSDDAFYCTELIAKLLNIPTRPMRINKAVWPKSYWVLDGQPGLSPDALYEWATQQ